MHVNAGLKIIFSISLLHMEHLFTGDVIEKCLLSTFMRVVLSVGNSIGKNL